LRVGEEAPLLAELDQVLEPRASRLGVLLGQLGRDEPFVLATAPAALALDLDLVDLRFEELERLLGALDRRLGRLAFRLGRDRLRRRLCRSELARARYVLSAQDLLVRPRLRGVTLQRAYAARLFLHCLCFLDPGFALLRHFGPPT